MACPERGHVLWWALVLLAVLSELALSALQVAAAEGVAVRAAEDRLRADWQLAALAAALEAVPVPRPAAAPGPWHPGLAAGQAQQGCAPSHQITQVRADCPATDSGGRSAWSWRLRHVDDPPDWQEEGTETGYWQGLQVQRWQLDVEAGRSGHGWRLDYRQQAAP